MTTHYMAQIDGVTVTRSTAGRSYSHVLVGFVNIARERAVNESEARLNYPSAVARLTKEANGQTFYLGWTTDAKMLEMFTSDLSPEAKAAKVAERKAEYMQRHEDQVAKSKAELADLLALGQEGYVAKALAEYDARDAARTNKTVEGTYYVCDLGWSSTAALAATNLRKHQKPGYRYDRLMILDAVVVPKAAKPSKSKATR